MNNEFKKWFAARARNPDKITLEEAFAAGAQAQPAPSVPIGWLDEADLRALQQGNAVWLHTEDQGRMIPVYLAAAAPEAKP